MSENNTQQVKECDYYTKNGTEYVMTNSVNDERTKNNLPELCVRPLSHDFRTNWEIQYELYRNERNYHISFFCFGITLPTLIIVFSYSRLFKFILDSTRNVAAVGKSSADSRQRTLTLLFVFSVSTIATWVPSWVFN